MPLFIVQSERKTWTKFLVEAPNEALALESDEDRYLGYVDGDNTEATVVGGPFANEEEALRDVSSYVDG